MEYLEKAGYGRREINVYLMLGLPGQEISGIKESIRHVQSLGATPRLCYFSPVPGTREWKGLVEKGKLNPDTDPLLQNKIAFHYLAGEISSQDMKTIGTLASGPDAVVSFDTIA